MWWDYRKLICRTKSHQKIITGVFWILFFFYVLYSTLLHLPPLRFHCVGYAGIETMGLLRLWHRLSDALTTRLDLISPKNLPVSIANSCFPNFCQTRKLPISRPSSVPRGCSCRRGRVNCRPPRIASGCCWASHAGSSLYQRRQSQW